jgi:hypothetical protein
VAEGFVRFGHPVHFLAFFDGAAATFRGLEQLGREFASAWLKTSSGSLPPFFEIWSNAP